MFGSDLSGVAERYARVYALTRECHEVFPYAFKGGLDEANCIKSGELLVEAKKVEDEALEMFREALNRL